MLTPVPNLNVTIDAYQIKIKDRILLSETLSGQVVIDALEAAGIRGIAGGLIFSNAADTRTRGLDIVGTYRAGLGDMGTATLSLSANFNKTTFTHIDPVPGPIAASGLALIGRTKRGDLTEGTPRNKFIANVLWEKDDLNMNLRATRFGKIVQRAGAPAFHTADFTACAVNVVSDICFRDFVDDTLKPKVIVDLEIGYKLTQGIKLSIGANNLLNTYPSKVRPVNQFVGFLYNAYAPYGISGGFYYTRLNIEF